MAERKRAIQLKFYVTEQERILIEEKMKLLQTDNLGSERIAETKWYTVRSAP